MLVYIIYMYGCIRYSFHVLCVQISKFHDQNVLQFVYIGAHPFAENVTLITFVQHFRVLCESR